MAEEIGYIGENLRMKTKIFHHIKNYSAIVLMLALSWVISVGSVRLLHSPFFEGAEHMALLPIIFDLVIVFSLGFAAYELSKATVIPSFVLAIFFGFVSQNVLSLITENSEALSLLTTIGAIFILFGGGLDTPFTRFKSLLGPITSIAFAGTIITAFMFSLLLSFLAVPLGATVPLGIALLLGSALASTDPAAIIPSFKSLLFLKPRVKHIAISESALNDVIGALITGLFLTLMVGGYEPDSILNAYAYLLSFDNLVTILKVIGIGVAAGVGGFFILNIWSKWKERSNSEGEADSALFLAVPLFVFTVASALGGNGFLAIFTTGLLFQLRTHVHHVEHYFNHTIEGFMKPLIFMLLGTLVQPEELLKVAPLGIVVGLLFMFVLRPLTVFITLAPFTLGKKGMTFRELLFLSFVRETGVIPAVLLVGIRVAGIPGSDTAVAIGMWVILLTLILQPPLTPFVAKKLGIAEDLPPFPKLKSKGPVAVLCSRGYSFLERLDTVVDWCTKHHVENLTLLHCPEGKYSEEFIQDVSNVAKVRFKSINDRLSGENRQELNFSFLGRPGKLEENIETLIEKDEIAIIFVGAKMLDYRLKDVKRLQVPFIFLKK